MEAELAVEDFELVFAGTEADGFEVDAAAGADRAGTVFAGVAEAAGLAERLEGEDLVMDNQAKKMLAKK
ncbi:MAG: hypothetical protein AB8A46_04890 [Prochlorococcus sp.]|nr:MAG: Uncharacterised protein [Prochlorococcus marinus str. MIT 9215]